MLVLSRRPNEKILFPTLGVSVQIVSVSKNVVRVGVDAPPSISIVRAEIADQPVEKAKPAEPAPSRHELRNRLHLANLAVHLAQKQLRAGLEKEAESTLSEALNEYSRLDQELAAEKTKQSKEEREIRALLVEDNSNESALLAQFLRLHGIKVETAHDGQDALDYLRSHDRPDVILLDMRMPRCDGPTTIAAIRNNTAYAGMKVFAVSGADPADCCLPGGTHSVDGWFTKPLDPTRLIDEMNQAFRRN